MPLLKPIQDYASSRSRLYVFECFTNLEYFYFFTQRQHTKSIQTYWNLQVSKHCDACHSLSSWHNQRARYHTTHILLQSVYPCISFSLKISHWIGKALSQFCANKLLKENDYDNSQKQRPTATPCYHQEVEEGNRQNSCHNRVSRLTICRDIHSRCNWKPKSMLSEPFLIIICCQSRRWML